jgi:Asp-tRNA(Asn)/Glu-tRNA(Gln) amidotransferase C subunit
MSEFTEHLLSPERVMSVTAQEINSLYKLSQIIGKLKSRSSVNESIETLTNFMEVVSKKSPELVDELQPCVSEYLTSRARVRAHDLMADKFREPGRETVSTPEQDAREAQLDLEDILAWSQKEQAVEASPAKPTGNPAPAPAPKPQPAASPAPPKFDLRKALRGTATSGPGKSFRKTMEKACAA